MYSLIRGKPLEEINFIAIKGKSGKYRNKMVCENIFSFDTEITSFFYNDGKISLFNYENPEVSKKSKKYSICYLWQFGIDDNIFIGRELSDFCDLLHDLSFYCNVVKICFVHNLGFDFVFLLNVLKFNSIFARTSRHPITAFCDQFNIEFRCSMMLTRLSLDKWANDKKLPIKKLVGSLNYEKIRTPYTALESQEIEYSVNDLLVIYHGISQYKEKYGALYKIPLTQTGEVRIECKKRMKTEVRYCMKCTSLMPTSLNEYNRFIKMFIGGTVLCNFLYKDRLIKNVDSYDIASSYPTVLVLEKYPMTKFYKCVPEKIEYYMTNPEYCYYIHFTCKNVDSMLNCHFLSSSKALKISGSECDNGRVMRCEYVELIFTNIDFELFKKCYSFTDFEIFDFRYSKLGYLNNEFRKFVLELYGNKTSLKGISEMENMYATSKQFINSLFGDMVTRLLTDDVIFDGMDWGKTLLTEEVFFEKIEKERRKSRSNYKAFQFGVWVTAYARRNLWKGIIALDDDICYCDTDSLKLVGNHKDFFEEYNKEVLSKHEQVAKEMGISVDLFRPKTPNGAIKPLGIFEHEGKQYPTYEEFKSLGAKQYIVKENGSINLTCAGISKTVSVLFNSVDDFEIDRHISEKELKECNALKLIPYYENNQPNIVFDDGYVSNFRFGVCLMPTTFDLSMTISDLSLLLGEVLAKRTLLFDSMKEV